MSFLDWIANWAEEHIPLVGSWIAELVRKLQSAIEGAWGWLEDAVDWIEDTWIPWAENQLSSLSDSLSSAWSEISDYLKPAIDYLSDALSDLKDLAESTAQELRQLITNFGEMVWNAIPNWLKEGAEKALNEIPRLWDSICTLYDNIREGLSNLTSLLYEELNNAKDALKAWASEKIARAEEWLSEKISAVENELSEKASELRNDLTTAKKELSDKLSGFREWVEEKVHGFTDAILSIDDYIAKALEGFIINLIMWFIGTFIDDLAHLQYDPETRQIYGKPKNPLTHILIWFFEVEKPENPYRSVKAELGVKDVGGAGYGGP